MEITNKQYDLMAHTLGINLYHAQHSDRQKDKFLPEEFYRNYFASSKGGDDYKDFMKLNKIGIVDTWNQNDYVYFAISEKGIEKFKNYWAENVFVNLKTPKGKQKYMDFIGLDGYGNFSDYLNIHLPKSEQSLHGWRFESTKYLNVRGKYCRTKELAKQSYKEALKLFKKNLKEQACN